MRRERHAVHVDGNRVKAMMAETRRCIHCQAELPLESSDEQCAACLLQSGAEMASPSHCLTAASAPEAATRDAAPQPVWSPQPEQLAASFPQLEILGILGRGGMGVVYQARQKSLDRLVAVKILPPKFEPDSAFAGRFLREARALAKLSHQNIVTVHDVGRADELYYFVMELVNGTNLRQLMHAGRLEPRKVLAIVMQICEALAYAHEEGVIHRDIKPENILIDQRGRVKIADFGLAKLLGTPTHHTITNPQQVMGTPHYMSPEQIQRPGEVDHRTDIYSLGVVFYEMLTGGLPLGRFSAPSAKVALDQRLDEIVLRALEQDPADRYPNIAAMQADLEALGATAPGLSGIGFAAFDPALATSETRQMDRTEQASGPAVGIDLGTTYSAIAFVDETGRPVTLVNAEGDLITPSLVLLEEGQAIVGKEALKAIATEAELVAQCAKRDLGSRLFHRAIQGRSFPPEALQAFILKKLRDDATRRLGPFSKVVITVPAYFDEVRRKATQDAGYMAGLEVLDIINEPTAAAIAHGFLKGLLRSDSGTDQRLKIMVYDLGGGTFDVTIMEIRGHDFHTLATDGDVKLGGQDWDQRLVDYVAQQFIAAHQLDPREDPNTAGHLWRECEDAKRTLSARSSVSISCDYRGHALRVKVTREQFEEMTQDLLTRTQFTTKQVLAVAGLTWNDLDQVLLVGGSTRMPMVAAMLKQLSGKDPDGSVAVDEAVAHGAALHAEILLAKARGEKPSFVVTNVNSHSLGVVATDLKSGRLRNSILIPRNTPLPVSAKRVFRTHKEGQKSILVQIVEGESPSPDACTPLGKCVVRNLPANLPAKTPIEVRFSYQENGRLTVYVHVAGTECELQQEIARENSFTTEQLDAWRAFIAGEVSTPPEMAGAAP